MRLAACEKNICDFNCEGSVKFSKKQEEDEDRRVKLVTCKQCFLVLSPDKNNQTGERHKLDQNI